MEIESTIIDKSIEEVKDREEMINSLQEKLDRINFQLDSINMQLDESVFSITIDEKARLIAEKSKLEEEKMEVKQELADAKKQAEKEETDLESAETFKGSLDENTEELFSARSIGKATVPKALATDKRTARVVDEENERSLNEEFKGKADDMMSRIDDLFR